MNPSRRWLNEVDLVGTRRTHGEHMFQQIQKADVLMRMTQAVLRTMCSIFSSTDAVLGIFEQPVRSVNVSSCEMTRVAHIQLRVVQISINPN